MLSRQHKRATHGLLNLAISGSKRLLSDGMLAVRQEDVDEDQLPYFIEDPSLHDPYSMDDGIRLLQWHAGPFRNDMVSLEYKLALDQKNAALVRGVALLPHAWGPPARVAVVTNDRIVQQAAREAGASLVGGTELIEKFLEDEIYQMIGQFDRMIAPRSMMPELGQVGRILGPLGKMPNPKVGAVTEEVADVIPRLRMWQQELRLDEVAAGQCSVGRVGYRVDYIKANLLAVLNAAWTSRPPSWKNSFPQGYIASLQLSSPQSPSIPIETVATLAKAVSFQLGQPTFNTAPDEIEAEAATTDNESSESYGLHDVQSSG